MAIVAKWLTHRIVAPAFVSSILIGRPIMLGYGQVVKAPDFDSEIEGSNPSSPAIAGVAELADALDLGSSSFGVQVQVLSPAPFDKSRHLWMSFFVPIRHLNINCVLKSPRIVLIMSTIGRNKRRRVLSCTTFIRTMQ